MPESMQDFWVGIIHKAGPLIGGIQRCLDCDGIMVDYRGAMVQEGHDHELPGGWEENADVTYWGPLRGPNQSAVGVHHPAIRCNAASAAV